MRLRKKAGVHSERSPRSTGEASATVWELSAGRKGKVNVPFDALFGFDDADVGLAEALFEHLREAFDAREQRLDLLGRCRVLRRAAKPGGRHGTIVHRARPTAQDEVVAKEPFRIPEGRVYVALSFTAHAHRGVHLRPARPPVAGSADG